MVDWLTKLVQARGVEDKTSATGVEKCNPCVPFQEIRGFPYSVFPGKSWR